jgi:hypothetical protein
MIYILIKKGTRDQKNHTGRTSSEGGKQRWVWDTRSHRPPKLTANHHKLWKGLEQTLAFSQFPPVSWSQTPSLHLYPLENKFLLFESISLWCWLSNLSKLINIASVVFAHVSSSKLKFFSEFYSLTFQVGFEQRNLA